MFNGALHAIDQVSCTDVIGVCQYGLELTPSASDDQLRYSQDLMKFFARLDLGRHFPDQTKLMTDLFDKILTVTHAKCSEAEKKPSVFLKRHSKLAWLVLPEAATTKLLTTPCWLVVQRELGEVVSSEICMRLFGSGLRSVQTELIKAKIQKAMDEHFATTDVSEITTQLQLALFSKS